MGLISFGKISKVQGLHGEVKFMPHSRELDNISILERIFIYKNPDDPPLELKITQSRTHNNSAFFKLEGINTIEDAQRLVGNIVYVDTADLRELEEGEYYWFDLIGLNTYTVEGRFVGVVDSLIDRSMQSILVVKNEDKEFLIPLAEPIVQEIDLEESKIIISPVEGLLD